MTRPRRTARSVRDSIRPMRRALRTALRLVPAAAVALVASACASEPDMGRPSGLADMRETLTERRMATRQVMDDAHAKPSVVEQAADGAGTFLGNAAELTLDVLSLRALGVW